MSAVGYAGGIAFILVLYILLVIVSKTGWAY